MPTLEAPQPADPLLVSHHEIWHPPQEVELVANASATGQLDEVQRIFSRYLTNLPKSYETNRTELSLFAPALAAAVTNNHPAIVSYLLQSGLPMTSLPTWEAIEAKSTEIFQIFIENGWDINEPMSRIKPPALAFILENKELTEWFLNHDASPNAMCAWDFTPLSSAVHHAPFAIIELLFQRGGDIGKGQLLHHAVKREVSDVLDVLRFLLDRGAPINQMKYQNHLPSQRERWLFGLGTPLHKAAELGRADVVSFLLENGADPALKDSKGKTALNLAEAKGHSEVVRLLDN